MDACLARFFSACEGIIARVLKICRELAMMGETPPAGTLLMRFLRLVLLAALSTILAAAVLAQDATRSGFGVVLMHGKDGMPGNMVGSTAAALQAAGAKVVMPEMPWSRSRM
jgi:hypothetical protein